MAPSTSSALFVAAAAACTTPGAGTSVDGRRTDDMPITKVVNLLKEMEKDLDKEYKQDKDAHEALTCWCKKMDVEKTKAVEDQKFQVDQLRSVINFSAGRAAELSTALDQLKQDIANDETSLKEGQANRGKEAAAFHAQEKELIEAIGLLKGAITTLSKHHQGSMLQQTQTSNAALEAMKPNLRHLVYRHLSLLGWLRENAYKKDILLNFLDARPELLEPDVVQPSPLAFLQKSGSRRSMTPGYTSYAPQSGQILGVLQQMKEAFEEDLPQIQQADMQKAEAFAEFEGTKKSAIQSMYEQKKAKQAELGETKHTLWEAKDDLEDTLASLSADQRFLLEMQDTCTEGEYAWERNSKARTAEIAAVGEAIKILSDDAVLDGQQTTFGFLQVGSRKALGAVQGGDNRVARAAHILQRLSKQRPMLNVGSELALLTSSTGGQDSEGEEDPIAKVVKAVGHLIENLKIEMSDEVKHRDFCKDELAENDRDVARENDEVARLDAQLAKLADHIATLNDEVHVLKVETATLQSELQGASETRQKESVAFQHTLADQVRAQAALGKAKQVLASVYMSKSFVQQPDAPRLREVQHHSGSNKIMTLIEKVIGDVQVEMDESVHDEQQAQEAYEAFVKDTNDSVRAKAELQLQKKKELMSTEAERDRSDDGKLAALAELDSLGKTRESLHEQCDFLLHNFDTRQQARGAEIESLQSVTYILSERL